jgi:23S rRNA (uridine2552-2'-O)-methyltransferase
MKRSKTSNQWLKEHFDDPYVQMAQKAGYRSRSSYKLLEIQEKTHLLKPGMTVVDLGAASGGWSQVAIKLVGDNGRVVASDILPMEGIAGVEIIQGDFTELAVIEQIIKALNGTADLVISDMAPNMSGMASVDQPQSMYLCELALDFAQRTLKPGGSFVVKVFHGEGFDAYVKALRGVFTTVKSIKPKASRPRSRETYIVAQGLKHV